MINYFSQVRLQLEQDLTKISLEENNTLCSAKKSLLVIRECCRKLSTLRLQCDFNNKEEWIYFFKGLKCYYYSQLYYYQDIIEIEVGMPNGSKELKQNFLKENLTSFGSSIKEFKEFFYWRAPGRCSLRSLFNCFCFNN